MNFNFIDFTGSTTVTSAWLIPQATFGYNATHGCRPSRRNMDPNILSRSWRGHYHPTRITHRTGRVSLVQRRSWLEIKVSSRSHGNVAKTKLRNEEGEFTFVLVAWPLCSYYTLINRQSFLLASVGGTWVLNAFSIVYTSEIQRSWIHSVLFSTHLLQ